MSVLDYAMMVEDTLVETKVIVYRRRGPDSFITGRGQGELIAVALTDKMGDGLSIAIRDHGPGIAPADLPHLFERFYRGDAAKARASGTGMGLWIARGLLAVEQGRVWAENCKDGGAQFTVVVPAPVKEAAPAVSPMA